VLLFFFFIVRGSGGLNDRSFSAELAAVDRELGLAHRAGEAHFLHRELRLVEREGFLA
jgi:hypothetical protein